MKKILVLITVLSLISFFLSIPAITQGQTGILSSLEKEINSLVNSVKPALVTIKSGELEKRITKSSEKKTVKITEPVSVGSGVIYSPDGYIVTSGSVVGFGENFRVTLSDGRELKANLVGRDDALNIAVLKVDEKNLTPAKFGNSDRLKESSWVTIVGNSFGLPNAVALGLINGIREDGFIQMSANVSPGNSGGPVLNSSGEVVGLVAAKISESAYMRIFIDENQKDKESFSFTPRVDLPSSGVSLAVPSNKIKESVTEIIRSGKVEKGYLGIYPTEISKETKEESGEDIEGIWVSDVVEDSPADKAGLEEEDIITYFDGKKVTGVEQFRKMVESVKPGETVKIKVLRDGGSRTLTAEMGKAESRIFGFENQYSEPYLKSKELFEKLKVPQVPEFRFRTDDEKLKKEIEQVIEKDLEKELSELKEALNRLQEELKTELKKLQEDLNKLKQKQGM